MPSRNQLPPFIGYLPASIDSALLELNNMTYPDYPPRRGRSGAGLAEARRLAIEVVVRYFNAHWHRRAAEVVAGAMYERRPFGLYLRNFGLGARRYPARDDPFGLPQEVTLASGRFDGALQRAIADQVVPQAPVLCIRNPVEEPHVLPAFGVGDDDWQDLAATLVRNAGLIVMYFFSATAGVVEELELIRRAGRQADTLLVIEEADPFEDAEWLAALVEAQRNEAAGIACSLDDFPQQVRHEEGAGWEVVGARLREMAERPLSAPVDQRIGLPVEYAPPDNLRRYCTQQATEGFDEAMRRIEARQFEEAEDLLHRAFTYAGWGRDLLGMATSLMTLGRLNESGFQAKGEAGAYYGLALDICREIRSESPTAEQIYTVLTQELARLRKEAEEKSG